VCTGQLSSLGVTPWLRKCVPLVVRGGWGGWGVCQHHQACNSMICGQRCFGLTDCHCCIERPSLGAQPTLCRVQRGGGLPAQQ
jgi:hypothetical protein